MNPAKQPDDPESVKRERSDRWKARASGAAPPFRVCLVDDLADYHRLFEAALRAEPGVELLSGFLNGRDALGQIPELKPDLVFIDARLGDMDGIDLLRKLHAVAPAAGAILVSAVHLDEHITWALENGSAGYIAKTDGPDCLVAAVADFKAGLPYLSPTVWRALARLTTGKAAANKSKFHLTETEWRVLQLLFSGKRRKEVAQALGCAKATVDVHCRHAFKKLVVKSLEEARAKLDWKHWEAR